MILNVAAAHAETTISSNYVSTPTKGIKKKTENSFLSYLLQRAKTIDLIYRKKTLQLSICYNNTFLFLAALPRKDSNKSSLSSFSSAEKLTSKSDSLFSCRYKEHLCQKYNEVALSISH